MQGAYEEALESPGSVKKYGWRKNRPLVQSTVPADGFGIERFYY